jgi:membrane-bound lytic murein transglycosylase D
MRSRFVARTLLGLGLILGPRVALAEIKPGSLPEWPGSGAGTQQTSRAATDLSRGAGARRVADEQRRPEKVEPDIKEPRPRLRAAESLDPPRRPASSQDAVTRRIIAQGPIDDDLKQGKDDPELRSLREAERVLFPRPLEGIELGFGFPLPYQGSADRDAAGLPIGSVTEEATPRPLTASDAAWLRSLALPNLPVRFDERVVRYLKFYRDAPSGRTIARAWARKAGRYAPILRAALARAGLPTDLVWLSLIESGHNPTISSPVGAAGLWQFMPDAGRTYGLTVDRWIDERLDPEASTIAAIRFLSDLYRRFGSWELSMAAYNMGHGGLSRAVRKYNTNSFWELARYEAGLPWETTLYVPKILATAVVMNNRRAFGLDGIAEDAPERSEFVVVGAGVRLAEVARRLGVPAATIEALNPHYLAGRTPPVAKAAPRASYRVRVPEGSAQKWTDRSVSLEDEELEVYSVRAGETVEAIAKSRGSSERELREHNRVGDSETLAPGTLLLVPKRRELLEPDPTSEQDVVVVPARGIELPDRKRVFYRVVSGDTVARIASVFQTTARELADWNALDLAARLEPGMTLQVFVPQTLKLGNVMHIPEPHARVLVAGSAEFSEYFEGRNGKKRLVIAARQGDTLSAIGKRYGMTIGQMERVNRRGRRDQLAAGERIVVYTERTSTAPGDRLFEGS